MKIKRYVVKDMQEAMSLIRRDLGPEAFIIGSRRVRTGKWFSILRPPLLEVTAAVDDAETLQQVVKQKNSGFQEGLLVKELAEMKSLLKKVTMGAQEPDTDSGIWKWKQLLQELEVNKNVMEILLKGIGENAGAEKVEEDEFYNLLLSRMVEILVSGSEAGLERSNTFAFVGPTGVGKTTTLAKLAARFALLHKKDVGLVTIDTYRIGAIEQIKTYGEIIGVPVEVAMTPEEFKEKVVKLRKEKEIVLIDTAGRPPKSLMGLAELRRFLEKVAPLEVFLVLSCTTRSRDLMQVLEEFKQLNFTRLIFTKLDETRSLGPILNVAYETQIPVAYVTNGQNVPEDIITVEPRELAKMIIGAVG